MDSGPPRTELDSHANMPVFGKHCYVFDSVHKRSCDVEPFDKNIGIAKSVPIVDAALAFTCQSTFKTYILIARNVLFVPTMEHNLIAPFIIREAGAKLNDTPKIHINNPNQDDHMIIFDELGLKIPLKLNGIFSYFETRAPTDQEIKDCDKIFITPDQYEWNPYSDHYALNEGAITDCDGDIVPMNKREKYIYENDTPLSIYDLKVKGSNKSENMICNCDCNELMDNVKFDNKIKNKYNESKFKMAIGSVNAGISKCELYASGTVNLSVSALSSKTQTTVSSESLAKLWCIDEKLAQKAIDKNTHLNRRTANNDLSKQFTTNDRMLRYRRINSVFFTDTFFVTKNAKSSRGHTCAQIFVSDKGYVCIYLMKSKSEFKEAIQLFCKEIGVPNSLIVDPSGEQTSNAVKKFCNQVGMTLKILEESTQWANRAELYIGLLKQSVRDDMRHADSPLVLWDYCLSRREHIHNLLPRDLFQLQGSTPTEATFGIPGDISKVCQFNWYDWCYYSEKSNIQFPYSRWQLGKVLGPTRNEGNEMSQYILKVNGRVIPRRTVRPLTVQEINSETEKHKRMTFDSKIKVLLGDSMELPNESIDKNKLLMDLKELDWVNEEDVDPSNVIEFADEDNQVDTEQSIRDSILDIELDLSVDGNIKHGKVIKPSVDKYGQPIGIEDPFILLNTKLYDVQFDDGSIRQYQANTIAQNMYQQVDEDGYSLTKLKAIIGHVKDQNAIEQSNGTVTTKSGQKRMVKSTAGWNMHVEFDDGSTQWIPLKILKETNPVDIAEYAVINNIVDEVAFRYWVPFTLKHREKIISSISHRVRKTKSKFGIEIPSCMNDVIKFDKKNGNDLWNQATIKEISMIKVAFHFLEEGEEIPEDYKRTSGHMIWDVKLDFTRKARWVKDGHKTPDPEWSTYAGVVSRETVRIALTYAALNEVPIMVADIRNAYLQAPASEKHYIVCGPEFGPGFEGRIGLIKRALYGGKSAGFDFWQHLRSCMEFLGFKSCKSDPELWMRKSTKPNKDQYWEYVLLYVDDCMCVSYNAKLVLEQEIGKYFCLKAESIGRPDIYLGNKVSLVTLGNGVKAYSLSSSRYVQNAVSNVTEHMKTRGLKFPKRISAPFPNGYRPEIDISTILNDNDVTYYQSLIGILRWIVELGRVDISCEASCMASQMAMPRQGHLDAVYHIFGYLKNNHNAELVLDPSEVKFDEGLFKRENWTNSPYGTDPIIFEDAPDLFGKIVRLIAYCDADHAGDLLTRRSRSGFLAYMNNALIHWMSKRQLSIETSSYGSEFTSLKQCSEYLRGLRYKLTMMGIPTETPSYIFGDNKSVLVNSSVPHSTLKKKSCSVSYHFVREGVARDEWRVEYISTDNNPSDLLSKPVPGGSKRRKLVGMTLHHTE